MASQTTVVFWPGGSAVLELFRLEGLNQIQLFQAVRQEQQQSLVLPIYPIHSAISHEKHEIHKAKTELKTSKQKRATMEEIAQNIAKLKADLKLVKRMIATEASWKQEIK